MCASRPASTAASRDSLNNRSACLKYQWTPSVSAHESSGRSSACWQVRSRRLDGSSSASMYSIRARVAMAIRTASTTASQGVIANTSLGADAIFRARLSRVIIRWTSRKASGSCKDACSRRPTLSGISTATMSPVPSFSCWLRRWTTTANASRSRTTGTNRNLPKASYSLFMSPGARLRQDGTQPFGP